MNLQTMVKAGILALLTIGAAGCSSKLEYERLVINGIEYQFKGQTITQQITDADDETHYGIISDIHGEVQKAESMAKELKRRGVEGIIVNGDIPLNEALRYGRRDARSDQTEIEEVLEVIAETGLPIYVIPGNHERREDYILALKEVWPRHPNLIDMTRYRIFDGDDVDFVSLPGYQIKSTGPYQFIPENGFFTDATEVERVGELRKGLDDTVVLITHGAGKTPDGMVGPDSLNLAGENVGDENITRMMQQYGLPFAVVGHIHQAGGYAVQFDGSPVKSGEWSEQFTANFGTLEQWKNNNGKTYQAMAGILTVKGRRAKFEMVYGE